MQAAALIPDSQKILAGKFRIAGFLHEHRDLVALRFQAACGHTMNLRHTCKMCPPRHSLFLSNRISGLIAFATGRHRVGRMMQAALKPISLNEVFLSKRIRRRTLRIRPQAIDALKIEVLFDQPPDLLAHGIGPVAVPSPSQVKRAKESQVILDRSEKLRRLCVHSAKRRIDCSINRAFRLRLPDPSSRSSPLKGEVLSTKSVLHWIPVCQSILAERGLRS